MPSRANGGAFRNLHLIRNGIYAWKLIIWLNLSLRVSDQDILLLVSFNRNLANKVNNMTQRAKLIQGKTEHIFFILVFLVTK